MDVGAVEVAGISFFSAGCPKLNPAKGEGLGAPLSEAGRVGLKPEGALSGFEVPFVDAAGSLKPPTAGRAGAFVDVGRDGLNPPVDDDVDVVGAAAGSVKPPALGILGGAGIAKDGLETSVVCFLAGAAVAVSSMVDASRFFGCGSAAVLTPPLPAFFLISSRYSLYSALTLSNTDAKLINGSSRIFTDKACTMDSFNPRIDVRYSISFWSSFGASDLVDALAGLELGSVVCFAREVVVVVVNAAARVAAAPNADDELASDGFPNPPNDDVELEGAKDGVSEDAATAGSGLGVVEGAPKLNPENGVLAVLPVSLTFFESSAAGTEVEADEAAMLVEVGVVVAAVAPKLNPENALGAAVSEADGAEAPKLNAGLADAGVVNAEAEMLLPKELEAGATELPKPAKVDVLDGVDPKADIGAAAAAGTAAYLRNYE